MHMCICDIYLPGFAISGPEGSQAYPNPGRWLVFSAGVHLQDGKSTILIAS